MSRGLHLLVETKNIVCVTCLHYILEGRNLVSSVTPKHGNAGEAKLSTVVGNVRAPVVVAVSGMFQFQVSIDKIKTRH